MIDPKTLARKTLFGLPSYKTGVSGKLLAALQSGAPVARLGSNENPFGPSPRVYEAIRETTGIHRYPDGANEALRRALGAHLDVSPNRIHVSTGSENVLSAVFHCVLSPGDRVVTLAPSFLLAEILAKSAGAQHVGVGYGDDLEFAPERVAEAVRDGAKLLYLSNPNNPTGNAFGPDELSAIVAATPESTLVVVDEAYFEYAVAHPGIEGSLDLLERSGRPYVVLRTFSKAYGLAGLRVGYGVMYHEDLVPLVRSASTIFDVGALAQVAALAALADPAHLERVVSDTLAEKRRLRSALEGSGVRMFPSYGNFVSLWQPTLEEALAVESRLADGAVFVKALPALDGAGLVRVSVGTREDNDRVIQAFS